MPKKKKKRSKKRIIETSFGSKVSKPKPTPPVPHAIIGAIEHHHVEAIAAVVPKEPVVIVALPKSTWQKIKESFGF